MQSGDAPRGRPVAGRAVPAGSVTGIAAATLQSQTSNLCKEPPVDLAKPRRQVL
jgi:hypothetical protein